MIGNLLVIAAILVLAGAFLWLKPSPRDRHLNTLRTKAMTEGFKLQSIRLPDTSVSGRLDERKELRTLYRLLHHFDKSHAPFFTVVRTTGVANAFLPEGWTWTDSNRPPEGVQERLTAFLERLPENVTAIDARPDGVGLVWDERGAAGELPILRETLEELVKLLSP